MAIKKIKKTTKKTIVKKTLKKKPVLSLKKKVRKLAKPVKVEKKNLAYPAYRSGRRQAGEKNKKQRKSSKAWLISPIIILILLGGYFAVAYFQTFWPFEKDYKVLESQVVIKKDLPLGVARLDWDNLKVVADEKISDTDSERKNLVNSSWASDSSRLVYFDEDKSLPVGLGGYPWKGKLYNFNDNSRQDLANFFYEMSGNDLKWIGKSSIAMFNNERKLIETNFDGADLIKIDLDQAISYDLSNDGRRLVLIKNDGEVIIKDLQNGEIRSLGREKNGDNITFLNPRWSHNSKYIAFLKRINNKLAYPKHENFEVGVVDSYIGKLVDFKKLGVTYIPSSEGAQVDMAWSLNDKFLLDNVSSNVYSVDPAKVLISNDEDSWQRMKSVLSPTSDKVLVFEYYKDNINSDPNHIIVDFYVMNLDGSKRIELLHKEGDINNDAWLLDIFGTWSADGEKIIYNSERKLWMVGSDGTNVRQLSNEDKDYSKVLWSAEGKKLVYLLGNEVRLITLSDALEKTAQVSNSQDISIKSDEQLIQTSEEEYLKGQTFSPDNKTILSERFSKTNEGSNEPLIVYYATNLENKETKKISDEIYSLGGSYKTKWLSDGTIVYDNLGSDGLKIIWADKDGNVLEQMKIDEWNRNWFGWDISSDGKEIITIDSGNKIYLHKKGESDAKILYEGDVKDSVNWIRWSPDKKYIVLLKGDKDVWLLKLDGDKVVENKRLGSNAVYGRDGGFDPESFVLWSPDSKKVIVQDSGNVLDVDKGIVVENLLPDYSVKFEVTPVSSDYKWSPDSQYIAYRQNDNFLSSKYDGSDKKTLAENNISVFEWSLDSSKIFFADDKGISVVNLDGSENKRLIEKDGKYSYLKLSADGSKLAYVKDGEVWMVELAK